MINQHELPPDPTEDELSLCVERIATSWNGLVVLVCDMVNNNELEPARIDPLVATYAQAVVQFAEAYAEECGQEDGFIGAGSLQAKFHNDRSAELAASFGVRLEHNAGNKDDVDTEIPSDFVACMLDTCNTTAEQQAKLSHYITNVSLMDIKTIFDLAQIELEAKERTIKAREAVGQKIGVGVVGLALGIGLFKLLHRSS